MNDKELAPDCEVHHHLMSDGRCTCHPDDSASDGNRKMNANTSYVSNHAEGAGFRKMTANSEKHAQSALGHHADRGRDQ